MGFSLAAVREIVVGAPLAAPKLRGRGKRGPNCEFRNLKVKELP